MCVDFTDLNRACPKDSYPLLNIDKLVDAAASYEYMSFMDTYSGYNQIRIHLEEEEKTTFMTDGLSYYYKVMPFRLKNIGVIYQRLMDKVFANQIDRNVEVYVDDMVANTPNSGDQCRDLEEIFA